MPFYIVTGTDTAAVRTRVGQLCEPFDQVEHFDLTVDGGQRMAEAAGTHPLFTGPRALIGSPAHALTVEAARTLNDTPSTGSTIIHGHSPVPAATRKAAGSAVWETYSSPTPRDATGRVRDVAGQLGMRLTGHPLRELSALAPGSWPVVRGALSRLAELGVTAPTMDDLRPLLGSAQAEATGWGVAEAVEHGDLPAVLDLAQRVEPIPTVAYLTKRYLTVGQLIDGEDVTVASAQNLLGTRNSAGARTVVALARRLGRARAVVVISELADLDRAVKLATDPHGTLTVGLVRLTQLVAPTRF